MIMTMVVMMIRREDDDNDDNNMDYDKTFVNIFMKQRNL